MNLVAGSRCALCGNHFLSDRRHGAALFIRDRLAEGFQANPATFGRAPIAPAHNVRAKSEGEPLMKLSSARWSATRHV
jgi:hypothetical protein